MSGAVEMLKRFGLNTYEAKAYNALLKLTDPTASRLAARSEIPRARVYDVLSSLEKKGFVLKRATRPVRFRSLPLDKAFENLERLRKEGVERELKELRGLKESLSKHLGKQAREHSSFESAYLVHGRANIYSVLANELRSAKQSVLIASTHKGLERKNKKLGKSLKKLSKKGVRVSFVKNPQARFVVIDKNIVLSFLNPDSDEGVEEKALFVNSPFLASFLFNSGKRLNT